MNKFQWLLALGGIAIIGWVGFYWQEESPETEAVVQKETVVTSPALAPRKPAAVPAPANGRGDSP